MLTWRSIRTSAPKIMNNIKAPTMSLTSESFLFIKLGNSWPDYPTLICTPSLIIVGSNFTQVVPIINQSRPFIKRSHQKKHVYN